MESNQHPLRLGTPDGSSSDAQKVLHELDADRATLAGRLAAPRWLYPAFGVVTAVYVASPAIESDAYRNVVVGLALAATIALLSAYQRISGVRVSPVGMRSGVVLAVLVCATLLLLSTSFGLAAADARWWITIPALVSFALVVILGRHFDRLYREQLRRGR